MILKHETVNVLLVEADPISANAAQDEMGGSVAVYINRGDIEFCAGICDGSTFNNLCEDILELLEPEHNGAIIY